MPYRQEVLLLLKQKSRELDKLLEMMSVDIILEDNSKDGSVFKLTVEIVAFWWSTTAFNVLLVRQEYVKLAKITGWLFTDLKHFQVPVFNETFQIIVGINRYSAR